MTSKGLKGFPSIGGEVSIAPSNNIITKSSVGDVSSIENISNEISSDVFQKLSVGSESFIDSYYELSEIFFKLSGDKIKIDFYDSFDENVDKINAYFDLILNESQYDISKIVQAYDIINKFLITNHGNVAESSSVYDLSRSVISKLEIFLKKNQIKKSDSLNNIIGRFFINHSHLKKIDYSVNKNALSDINEILKDQVEGLNIVNNSNFGGIFEHANLSKKIFLINHIYSYGKMLNFIDKNNFSLKDIKVDYFNFDILRFSIEERKKYLIDTTSNLILSIVLGSGKDILTDEYLDIESNLCSLFDCNYVDYDKALFLELVDNYLLLGGFNDIYNLIDFGDVLLSKDFNSDRSYNIMKLRVLNSILHMIDETGVCDDKVEGFLLNIKKNIKDSGPEYLFFYARLNLFISKINSKFFLHNRDLEYKEKSVESMSDYHILFGNKYPGGDYKEISKDSLNNLYGQFSQVLNEDVLDYMYSQDEERILLLRKNDALSSMNKILLNIFGNDFNFDEINIFLKDIGHNIFKDTCSMKVIKKNGLSVDLKFYNQYLDLKSDYILNFKINKRFKKIFSNIFTSNDSMLYGISDLLKDFIDKNKKMLFNKYIENIIENSPENILLYLQEIVDIKGNVHKYEALTRIRGKNGNNILPNDVFETLLKDTDLHYRFTLLQIERVLNLSIKKNIDISVNISTQDLILNGQSLIEDMKRLYLKYKDKAFSRITFEILEDDFIKGLNNGGDGNISMHNILGQLKSMGLNFAIDDYGSGESNLPRVISLADFIEYIKFDGNLVKNLVDRNGKINEKNYSILKSSIEGFHEIGKKVICEYVEDKSIADLLIKLGVDYMQGYHYNEPFDSLELKEG